MYIQMNNRCGKKSV